MPPVRPRRRQAAVEPGPPIAAELPVVGGLPLGVGAEPSPRLARPFVVPGLSVEAAAYALLLLVSLLLRFWQLGERPLDPAETRTALASLEVARGGRFPSDAGALLGFGDALLFAVAGATDAGARFLPALLGGLIPLALLPARRQLGRATALLAATFLTFSPLLIDQARVVGSAAIAATLATALVFTLFGYAARRRPRQLYWGALLLAGALTAGASAFSTLAALLTFGLYELARAGAGLPADLDAALVALAPANGHAPGQPLPEAARSHQRERVLTAIGLCLGALALIGTGAMIDPSGIGEGLFAPVGAWLSAFGPGGRQLPLWSVPLSLVAYEPLALVFGALGALLALRAPRPLDRFLVWWLVVALAVAIASPDRSAALLAPALLPAYVLAAAAVRRLLERVWPGQRLAYLVGLAVLLWGGALLIVGWGQATLTDAVGVRYIAASAGLSEERVRQLVAVLPAAALAVALVYLWRRFGPAGRPALGLAAATVLAAATLHAGWNLAYQVVGLTAELPHREQTVVDVRALADDVDEVSQVLTINRKDKTLVIHESLRYPLAWYLRGDNVRFEPRAAGAPAMLILPVDDKPPAGRYSGQRYGVVARGEPAPETLAQLWRWLVYRETSAPTQGRDVNLFVRAQ
ncbi:MAG TPA: hypothetical protein VGL23_02515 [Chloroflexota bacterium]